MNFESLIYVVIRSGGKFFVSLEKVCIFHHRFLREYLFRVVDPDPEPDPYWIRIQLGLWIRIRIRNPDTDPDPGGQK